MHFRALVVWFSQYRKTWAITSQVSKSIHDEQRLNYVEGKPNDCVRPSASAWPPWLLRNLTRETPREFLYYFIKIEEKGSCLGKIHGTVVFDSCSDFRPNTSSPIGSLDPENRSSGCERYAEQLYSNWVTIELDLNSIQAGLALSIVVVCGAIWKGRQRKSVARVGMEWLGLGNTL